MWRSATSMCVLSNDKPHFQIPLIDSNSNRHLYSFPRKITGDHCAWCPRFQRISLPSSYQDLQRWEKWWQRDIGKLQDLVESQKKLDRTVTGWIRDNTGDCHKCWDNNYNARKVKHYHPWLPREWNSVGSRKINGWHGESLGGCSYTSKK